MNKTSSWDERLEEFISVLCYKNAKYSSATSTKPIPTNKIFLNKPLLSTLVISFFLEDDEDNIIEKDDIFTQIKDRAKNIITKGIINVEIDKLIKNLQPIKDLLLEYLIIPKDKRSIHIKNLVEKCDLFFEDLLKNKQIIHLIPFTITFAIVHLTVLRESLKLKTSDFSELRAIISRYQNHFTDSFLQFFTWRMNKITTKTLISHNVNSTSLFSLQANGEVKDEINNKIVTYFTNSSNDQIFTKAFDLIKLRMFNEAKAEFMKMFLHVFSLVNFTPNHKVPWPLDISSFWVGPYGIDTFPDGRHNFDDNSSLFYNISDDKPGVITKIELRYWDIVDRIQGFYEGGRVGKEIGTSQGGTGYTISNLDKFSRYIIAVNLKFGWGLLCAIEFIFNDGKTTGLMGNKQNHPITGAIQIGPFGKHNEFRLSGMIGGGGIRDNITRGENIGHIAFQFQYVEL